MGKYICTEQCKWKTVALEEGLLAVQKSPSRKRTLAVLFSVAKGKPRLETNKIFITNGKIGNGNGKME